MMFSAPAADKRSCNPVHGRKRHALRGPHAPHPSRDMCREPQSVVGNHGHPSTAPIKISRLRAHPHVHGPRDAEVDHPPLLEVHVSNAGRQGGPVCHHGVVHRPEVRRRVAPATGIGLTCRIHESARVHVRDPLAIGARGTEACDHRPRRRLPCLVERVQQLLQEPKRAPVSPMSTHFRDPAVQSVLKPLGAPSLL